MLTWMLQNKLIAASDGSNSERKARHSQGFITREYISTIISSRSRMQGNVLEISGNCTVKYRKA